MEKERCAVYSEALRIPLENSNRAAYTSTLLYAITQALSFFVISLVFYVGATVSLGAGNHGDFTTY